MTAPYLVGQKAFGFVVLFVSSDYISVSCISSKLDMTVTITKDQKRDVKKTLKESVCPVSILLQLRI